MKQYIDKTSLVEALNKNIRSITRLLELSKERDIDIHLLAKVHAYEDMKDFIETLEVKEVDLKKEIYNAEKRFGDIDEMGGYRILIFDDEFRDVLRHFYELGLKSKGE